jgi:hypothetical protein
MIFAFCSLPGMLFLQNLTWNILFYQKCQIECGIFCEVLFDHLFKKDHIYPWIIFLYTPQRSSHCLKISNCLCLSIYPPQQECEPHNKKEITWFITKGVPWAPTRQVQCPRTTVPFCICYKFRIFFPKAFRDKKIHKKQNQKTLKTEKRCS